MQPPSITTHGWLYRGRLTVFATRTVPWATSLASSTTAPASGALSAGAVSRAALQPSSRGHSLGQITIASPGPSSSAAAAPIQLGKPKLVKIRSSRARFARRWQAAYGSKKNLATIKLRHRKSRRLLYLNSESLGMGNKSFTSPWEKVKTKQGTRKRRKHSEPQLLLALQNQKLQLGKKTIDLSKYDPEWAFSTNEACGHKGEGCGHEIVPSLVPGNKPFYFQNPYQGSGESGGFSKSYNQHYMKDEDSDTESEAEDDIEDVLMIKPKGMRGVDFSKKDTIPVTSLDSFLQKGKHTKKTKGGKSSRRWKRYEDREGWGYS